MIHHGDCLEVMPTLPASSVDAIVTDPPYGLGFMGKHWDRGVPGPDFWAEMLRLAKPSSYLLAFGGTRTVHRIATAIEDAGWIIRDMLVWAYASGFPKSKASLKPAWEPIVMARKPGPLRDLAIDACRIGLGDEGVDDREGELTADTRYGDKVRATPGRRIVRRTAQPASVGTLSQGERPVGEIASASPLGRWPANVILTDPIFDGGIEGVVGGGEASTGGSINGRPVTGYSKGWADERWFESYGDSGTYSRFFLIPKADRAEREPIGGMLPEKVARITEGHGRGPVNTSKGDGTGIRENRPRSNVHPTVKPVDLMRHLVRLVSPAGGTVLDPFLGSGTTGIACEMEGFDWIGIEREAEYVRIAEARLVGVQKGMGLSA